MSKCGPNCTSCPLINETKSITINNHATWKLNGNFKTDNLNIIYLIDCKICRKRYIAESGSEI